MIGIFTGRGLHETSVFAQIDVDFRKHIHEFNDNGSLSSLGVFLCIALHANSGGWTWISRERIKKETGITTERALTKALKHLRDVRIGGHRIFAHYREARQGGKFGKSAYLIFPDLEHPEPPFEGMVEFSTDSTDGANARDGNAPTKSITSIKETKESVSKKQETRAPSPKKPEKRINKNAVRAEIEQYFISKTRLPAPKTANQKERRSAGTLWWNPIRDMLDVVDWDAGKCKYIVNLVVDEMRDSSLTISSPKSILNPYIAKFAELSQRNHRGRTTYVKTHI